MIVNLVPAFLALTTYATNVQSHPQSNTLQIAPSSAVILDGNRGHEGRFRVIFRITSTGDDIPFAVIHEGSESTYSNALLNWNAYLSNGSACQADPDETTGIHIVRGRNGTVENGLATLNEMSSSRSHADSQRPTFVSTVFECDLPVVADEVIAIQASLYVLDGRAWRDTIYTVENIPFAE